MSWPLINFATGDMSENLTCAICEEIYSPDDRKPVILHCGHTFCCLCLLQIQELGTPRCPSCRRVFSDTTVNDLPVNFALLQIAENVQHRQEMCAVHREEKRFWCYTCQVSICSLCIINNHTGNEHVIVQINDKEQKQLARDFHEILSSASTLQQNVTNSVNGDINELFLKLKFIHDIKQFKTMVDVFCNQAQKCSNPSAIADLKDSRDNSKEKMSRLSAALEKRKTRNTDVNQTPSSYLLQSDSLDIATHDGKGRGATLTWEGNKLHASSFSTESLNSDILLHWNMVSRMVPKDKPEVFLELSADSKYLGKIYIKLWGHLRRAHHFIALCVGSLGPSYKGMVFGDGLKSWKNASVLLGDHYLNSKGETRWKGLMNYLEWGGENARSCGGGYVVSFSNNNPELDAAFAIVTESNPDTYFNCPFGEVVSGLEVAVKASQYEPRSRVKVSRCGIILPFLEK